MLTWRLERGTLVTVRHTGCAAFGFPLYANGQRRRSLLDVDA